VGRSDGPAHRYRSLVFYAAERSTVTLRENSKAFRAFASQQKPHGSNRHRPAPVSDSDNDRLEALVIGHLGRRLSLDRCGRSREEVQLQVLVIRDGEAIIHGRLSGAYFLRLLVA